MPRTIFLSSYVKGSSIHNTFNRGVNINNTDGVLIEDNVIHDVLGADLVLHGGLDESDTTQHSLIVNVKNRCLGDPVPAAAIWMSQLNTTVRSNVVAGGTNVGFW